MKRSFHFSLLLVLAMAGVVLAQQTQPQAPAAPTAAWTKTQALKAEDFLTIYVDPGNVRIMPTDKKEVTIKTDGVRKEDLGRIQFTTGEKNLKLDFRGDKSVIGTFIVFVPTTFNLDVYAGGDLTVQGALNGKLKFRTAAGNIEMGDISGNLNINSTEGDVTVGNITGNGVITTNADIDVEDVSGDIDLKNEDGDTTVKNIGGNVNAKTGDGDVSLGEVTGNATVLAGIGDVELEKVGGIATLTTDEGDIDMYQVPGMVVASSNSGEITLQKVTGAADAKTDDGDISAEMYSGSGGSSKFYSNGGDIDISFPDTAKATVDARYKATAPDATKKSAKEDAEDVITSDWKATRTDKDGGDFVNKYEINGGGDTILVQTTSGSISITKLAPMPAAKKNQ